MAEDYEEENPAGDAPKRTATRRARKKKGAVETGRKQKEFTYRGHETEALKAMRPEDVLKVLPSRARRFLKRNTGDVEKAFLAKVAAAGEGEYVRTHYRDFPIIPLFVGKGFEVHSGKEWHKVVVTSEMIGHKLGEFAPTRRFGAHTGPGVGATRSSKFMPLK